MAERASETKEMEQQRKKAAARDARMRARPLAHSRFVSSAVMVSILPLLRPSYARARARYVPPTTHIINTSRLLFRTHRVKMALCGISNGEMAELVS